jgi:pimeloyl-ACP methyl ester carboxylesterase
MHSVILLPGLAHDAAAWRDVRPALDLRHRVQVSDVHFHHDTLPQMAAALWAEHPGRHVLIGHSMGGMLAMEAALQAPGRVEALALLATSARADTDALITLRTGAISMFEAGRLDEVLRANLMFAFHPRHAAGSPIPDRYLDDMRRAGASALIRQNRAVMARRDLRPKLPAITCPTLLMCGEADLITPPEHTHELAAGLPAARTVWLKDCGHMLTLEQPGEVARQLLAWLDELR